MYDKEKVIKKIYNSVSTVRGLGESGKRVVILKKKCEKCGHDRLVCKEEVNPERKNTYKYYCLSPNCPDFVSEKLSHLFHLN